MNNLKIVFIDHITLISLLKVMLYYRTCTKIVHFEPISGFLNRIISVVTKMGLLRVQLHKVDYHVGHIKDNKGESLTQQLFSDARDICAEIKKNNLLSSSLINAMGKVWDRKKIVLYFEKIIEMQMIRECMRIRLAEWMLRTQFDNCHEKSVVLIEKNRWFSYLEKYAAKYKIRLVHYDRSIGGTFKNIYDSVKMTIPIAGKIVQSVFHSLKLRRNGHHKKEFGNKYKYPDHKIAIQSAFKNLSFDLSNRSDLFWLDGGQIPLSEILIYSYVHDNSLNGKTVSELKSKGSKIYGQGPGIQSWKPNKRILNTAFKTCYLLFSSVVSCIGNRQYVSFYDLSMLSQLSFRYAYWYNFYESNKILLDVMPIYCSSIPKVLALESLKGVSVLYQYSIADINTPTNLISDGDSVQFFFSKISEQLLSGDIEMPGERFVNIGYIHDRAFQNIRKSQDVINIRNELQNNGADFIICYFDENSSDQWDINISHEDAADEFEYFLHWLIADPTLGLIIKPKKPLRLLFDRISRVSDIIEIAEKTGRCKFLTNETVGRHILPAEAALMSHLCVGNLLGGTASLESHLAGVPALLIDNKNTYSHPYYSWGLNKVIYNDLDSLKKAVETYRVAPFKYPDFGKWSPVLNKLDPFQDGQASLRMENYIRWTYESLKEGLPREKALTFATEKFDQTWGKGHISCGIGTQP